MISFVLMNISPNMEREVFEKIGGISEVKEHHSLFGEYDMIAKIEVNNLDDLGATVSGKIRAIAGVTDTKTLPGVAFGI